MKEKKVLLINQGNTLNYGDYAIHQTLETFLNNKNIKTDFHPYWYEPLIFGENYDNYSLKTKKFLFKYNTILDYFYSKSIKNIVSNIKQYNAIVIGGGELLGTHKGFNSSLRIWSKIAEKNNIPLYLFGVSGDLNMNEYMLKSNKKALKKASFICVRDGHSHNVFTNYYNVNNICMPDVAFAYNQLKNISPSEENNKNSLLFVPIELLNTVKKNLNTPNEKEYFKYLLNLMNNKLGNLKNVIITTTVATDNEIAEKFYEYTCKNIKNNITVSLHKYTNIQDYYSLLSKSKIVVSARMHALIFALLNNCEIHAIPFKQKLITFEKEYKDTKNINPIIAESFKELELLYKLIENS